ncbi:hypothetical protein Ancab_026428 [Ancistrocladus abbreviatus]
MEDSFRVRVDRAFGSLSSLSSSEPLSSSLWSLTDEEVEKREWKRDTRIDEEDDLGCLPNVDGFFSKQKSPAAGGSSSASRDYRKELENDLEQLDDGDGDDDDDDDVVEGNGGERLRSCSSSSQGGTNYDEDEWDVRNSIGMDCTLDYEEEEDEYDKVAVGREKAGERVYMRDVADYVPRVNSHNELPNTFRKATKDPRANHLAAKLRLKEDAEAAGDFNSLRVSDETVTNAPVAQTNDTSEDGDGPPKSILKRKVNHMDTKSEKRVRFDPGCKTEEEAVTEISTFKVACSLPEGSSGVPDYICNPSKYTHYTFDSTSDMDEESNCRAYMDFFNLLMKSKKSEPEEAPADLSKPVIFNPKKKDGDASSAMTDHNREIVTEDYIERRNFAVSFASGDTQDEVSAMEEDEPETEAEKAKNKKKTARQYRSKVNSEEHESEP